MTNKYVRVQKQSKKAHHPNKKRTTVNGPVEGISDPSVLFFANLNAEGRFVYQVLMPTCSTASSWGKTTVPTTAIMI